MSKKKELISQDTIEFQTDALELMNRRLPWWARYGLLYAVLIFVAAIVWACIGKVDVIVACEGKVVSDKDIVLKPMELSYIKKIHVRPGDQVKAGDILVSFDSTLNQAEFERYQAQYESLKAELARIRAEAAGDEYVISENPSYEEQQQLKVFKQRQLLYQEQMKYYDQSVKQAEAAVKSCDDGVVNLSKELETLDKRIAMYQKIADNHGDVTPEKLLELELNRQQYIRSLTDAKNNSSETRFQLSSTIARRNAYVEEWQRDIAESLVSVERDFSSIEKQYEKTQRMLEYTELRAPVDAIVHEVAAFSEGSAVQEAEALITLVPLSSDHEMEIEIQARDIGKVAVGDRVRVKLNAFPYQKHGTLEGNILNISENTFQRQANEPGALVYYRARISLHGNLKLLPSNFRLRPGMEAQAEIITGDRRIIEYVLFPLTKALDEAIREP